ncbi:MAG: hypothetical protein PWR01_3302 [Clostridiales bacterium]|jgi:hypothetical protein|nr:hypothetical protein [Clostridiales bacterium]MDN5282229.1 hypothetical protein [Candidatus Ozemobacter sp.]
MTSFKTLKKLGLLCLGAFLLAAPQVFAQDDLDDFGGLDDLGGDSMITESPSDFGDGMMAESTGSAEGGFDAPKMNESEQVDALSNKFKFSPENPKKDPFKPLVEKKVILPPVRTVRPVSKPSDNKPKAPPIKPIKLHVAGIVGNEGNRLAVVKFENNEYTIVKDQVVDGKFKVVDILNDRVVVYSNKEQRRHTFKIGGDSRD